jgi:hypothetical protein
MSQTPKTPSEAPKNTRKTEKQATPDTLFPIDFSQFQTRNVAVLAEANNILMQTAKAIWENETRLFQMETEQVRDSAANLRPGKMPASLFSDMFEQWHRNSEKSIEHLRAINDLMRSCEWQLLDLFANKLTKKPAE